MMRLFIKAGQSLFPAKRGGNHRYPRATRRDRLALFFHRLPYRLGNKHMRPDGEVVDNGRWHLPCRLFGHLYETEAVTWRDFDHNQTRAVQRHQCTCCGLSIVDRHG